MTMWPVWHCYSLLCTTHHTPYHLCHHHPGCDVTHRTGWLLYLHTIHILTPVKVKDILKGWPHLFSMSIMHRHVSSPGNWNVIHPLCVAAPWDVQCTCTLVFWYILNNSKCTSHTNAQVWPSLTNLLLVSFPSQMNSKTIRSNFMASFIWTND